MLYPMAKIKPCVCGISAKCVAARNLKLWKANRTVLSISITGFWPWLPANHTSSRICRYPYYPKPKFKAHPQDCSVMTYRGHHVFRTLIRCHFSPGDTTGGQYIYSGSSDGKIHVQIHRHLLLSNYAYNDHS
jgi:hypothetical protein